MKNVIATVLMCILVSVSCEEEDEREIEDELAEPWQDNCEAMDPGNKTFQTEHFPYLLTLSATTINCFQGVYLTLRAPPPFTFQGFMVQGRDSKTGEPVGEFDSQYKDVKVINCFGGLENTATHADNSTKTEVKMRWASGTEEELAIVFFVTVAEKVEPVENYWVRQRMANLRVNKSPYKTPAPPPWWEEESRSGESFPSSMHV